MSQTDPLSTLNELLTALNRSCETALQVGTYFKKVISTNREVALEVGTLVRAYFDATTRARPAIKRLYELGDGPVEGLVVYRADDAAKNLGHLTPNYEATEHLADWGLSSVSFLDDSEREHAAVARWIEKHGKEATQRADEVRALHAGTAETAIEGVTAIRAWAESAQQELSAVDEKWEAIVDKHGGAKAPHLALHTKVSEQLTHYAVCHVAILLACNDYIEQTKHSAES